MRLLGFFTAAFAALTMAIAFQGLAFAKTQKKVAIAISLSVVSVCAFAVLVALLI